MRKKLLWGEFWEHIVGEICSTEIWSTDFDYSPEKY